MKAHYDPESDMLYMVVREGGIKETVEADRDIFAEIAEDEGTAGVEVWSIKEC
jgi:uncharacterized protein YuzE